MLLLVCQIFALAPQALERLPRIISQNRKAGRPGECLASPGTRKRSPDGYEFKPSAWVNGDSAAGNPPTWRISFNYNGQHTGGKWYAVLWCWFKAEGNARASGTFVLDVDVDEL